MKRERRLKIQGMMNETGWTRVKGWDGSIVRNRMERTSAGYVGRMRRQCVSHCWRWRIRRDKQILRSSVNRKAFWPGISGMSVGSMTSSSVRGWRRRDVILAVQDGGWIWLIGDHWQERKVRLRRDPVQDRRRGWGIECLHTLKY